MASSMAPGRVEQGQPGQAASAQRVSGLPLHAADACASADSTPTSGAPVRRQTSQDSKAMEQVSQPALASFPSSPIPRPRVTHGTGTGVAMNIGRRSTGSSLSSVSLHDRRYSSTSSLAAQAYPSGEVLHPGATSSEAVAVHS